MSNQNIQQDVYKNYHSKFQYILSGFKCDFKNEELNNYVSLLNNQDIVSSLFTDTARDIHEYSETYDVDIKFIDDIKILCFLAMNIYKIVDKDTSFTKKYLIFHSMLYRFNKHLPYKDYNNKIIIKLTYMFTNLSSYSDLLKNNGKFGLFQVLKSIYNVQKDFFDSNIIPKNQTELENYESNIFVKKENLDFTIEDIETVNTQLGEVPLKDWVIGDTKNV